jgi:zinc transporter
MAYSEETQLGHGGLRREGHGNSLGLVWGYRFNEDGCADLLDQAEGLSAYERHESWLWLHFDLADQRAHAAIKSLPGLPAEVIDLLLGSDPRQRIAIVDQHIAGVVADFERSDMLDPRSMSTWRFCMAPHAFISTRRSPLHTMSRLHDDLRAGRRLPGVLHLFDAIVHGFAAGLSAVSQRLVEQLDAIEDSLLDEQEGGDFAALGAVRRNAVRLNRQTAPLRAILRQINEERPAWFTEDAAEDCAQVAHHVESVAADLVSLQERAHALQDEFNARQTALTNRRLMLLSVMSAVLLPPTLITGIFGMNVDGLPLKDASPYGFVLTMGIMVVSVVALLIVLRRMKIF